MNEPKRTRRISSKELRGILGDFADKVCAAQRLITLSMRGNTFAIHLEGATVNISVTEEGGAA